MDTVIITKRLTLRPLRDEDAAAIFKSLNDYDVSRNLARVPYPYLLSDAQVFIDWTRSLDHRSAMRALCLSQSPDVLFGIMSYEYSADQQDAELGYWLAKSMWNKGFGKEAASAMVDHAFNVSGAEKLVSGFFKDNPVSGKILSGVGFEPIADSTQFSKAQGHEVPISKMQLTRERWLKQRQGIVE